MKNTKKNMKGLVRSLSFILVFCLIFAYCSNVFSPKGKTDSTGMSSCITGAYKGEAKNSIDVMMVGNSDIYRAINPIQIWEDKRITTCVMGMPSITTAEIYHKLVEMFKYQSPKLVVFETDCMFTTINKFDKNGNLAEDDNKRTIEQGIAYGIKKFHENFTNVDEAIIAGINYKFPLMKYNYRWKDLNKNDFVNLRGKYKFIAKGFIADKKAQRFEHGKTYLGKQNSKAEEIDRNTQKYFDKILDLCQKHNCRLALVSIPAGTSWNYSKHNAVKELAAKNNLIFIDYNTDMNKIDNFNWETDTKDGGNHLNYSGAVKVTYAFEQELTDTFNLTPSELSEDVISSWNEDTERFYSEVINEE